MAGDEVQHDDNLYSGIVVFFVVCVSSKFTADLCVLLHPYSVY